MSTCDWGFSFEAMKTYHDTEWGVPVHDDRVMFEHLMMEAMQCGLSWSLMLKKREIFLCFIAGTLSEHIHARSALYFFDGVEHHLHAGFEVVSVEKQAADVVHPDLEDRDLPHGFLGHVTARTFHVTVGDDDVPDTAVIACEHDRFVGDIFRTDDRDLCAGDLQQNAEGPCDHPLGDASALFRIFSADQGKNAEYGKRENQVQYCKNNADQ